MNSALRIAIQYFDHSKLNKVRTKNYRSNLLFCWRNYSVFRSVYKSKATKKRSEN